MKQELTWGTAAAVAIVAAVGISSQSGGKPFSPLSTGRESAQSIVGAKAPNKGKPGKGVQPQCIDSIPMLEHFFFHEKITGPASCYSSKPTPTPLNARFQTRFVIATLPDPLHTHFSLLFDRLVEAIQEGAQDEEYEYDSSWLPWETEESSLPLLKDEDDAEERKEKREDQPGILLFRGPGQFPYQDALVVFIVGEEPTRGIHRAQFENAVAWIGVLHAIWRQAAIGRHSRADIFRVISILDGPAGQNQYCEEPEWRDSIFNLLRQRLQPRRRQAFRSDQRNRFPKFCPGRQD